MQGQPLQQPPAQQYPAQPQPQGVQPSSYWNQGSSDYVLPSRQADPAWGEPKRASKTVLYALAVIIFLAGFFLIYKGVTATPPKLSSAALLVGKNDSAVFGIVCKPCGTLQESSLAAIVGKDNYKGIIKNQLGQQIMIARATGGQIQSLAEKDWIKYIDRIE